MFGRINTVYLSFVFALCASVAIVNGQHHSECSDGVIQCCASINEPSDPDVTALAEALGLLEPILSTVGRE
ncbi:hypothetical protein E4T56_gene17372 [Termitomyces sp. T112]|nr:hypothetical protein E4T56_gene17372 [Termitomyces sp. T112]